MIKQVEHMLSKCHRQFAFSVLLLLAGNARLDSDDFCKSRLQNVLFPNMGHKKASPSPLLLPIVAKASQLNLADSKREKNPPLNGRKGYGEFKINPKGILNAALYEMVPRALLIDFLFICKVFEHTYACLF